MALHQYIGARYVPKFYENSLGSAEWQSGVIYEPLTIVTYNNNSYTSKKAVPATVGDPSSNPEYWVATGVFNEQLSALSSAVSALSGRVDDIEDIIDRVTKVYPTYSDMIADFREDDDICLVLDSAVQLLEIPVYKPHRGNFYKWESGTAYYEFTLAHGGHAELITPAFTPKTGSTSAVDALPFLMDVAYSYCGVNKAGGFTLDDGTVVTNVRAQSESGPYITNRNQAIQCSQFIDVLLNGLYYEKSKLANPNNANLRGGGACDCFVYDGTPLYLSANEMAHVCAANGWLKETVKLSDVEIGDLAFWQCDDGAANWRGINHVALCVGKFDTAVVFVEVGYIPEPAVGNLPVRRTVRMPGITDDAVHFTVFYGDLATPFIYNDANSHQTKFFGIGRIAYNAPKLEPNYTLTQTLSGTYSAGAANAFATLVNGSEHMRFGVIDLRGYVEEKNAGAGGILVCSTYDTAGATINFFVNTDTSGFNGGTSVVIFNFDGDVKGNKMQFGARLSDTTDGGEYKMKGVLRTYI